VSLTFYFHPLASFCHKVLIALYEKQIAFEPSIVDLGNAAARAQYLELWPVGKIPVLHDHARDRTIPETTIMIEYLDRYYPGACRLFPDDADALLEARLWDRFFDQYVSVPMQKIVGDRLRAEGERDPRGVAEARDALGLAYDMLQQRFATRTWAIGESFTVADCAALPALFYSDTLRPFAQKHPTRSAYYELLLARPSVRRTLAEARPYFQFYPYREALPARFLSE
jgi:glutathione S-transferase